MKVLFDCSKYGVSGDMILAALLDLGASSDLLTAVATKACRTLGDCKQVELRMYRDNKRPSANHLDVLAKEPRERSAVAVKNAVYTLADPLSKTASRFARNAIDLLISKEVVFHGQPVDEIRLHELGSVDTVIDIVGAAALFDELGFFSAKLYSTPAALGSGKISFSHGTFPVPVPIVKMIVAERKIPVARTKIRGELTTPTGITLLASLRPKFVKKTFAGRTGSARGAKDFKSNSCFRIVVA